MASPLSATKGPTSVAVWLTLHFGRCTVVVDRCIQVCIVGKRQTAFKVGHNVVDADVEEGPCFLEVGGPWRRFRQIARRRRTRCSWGHYGGKRKKCGGITLSQKDGGSDTATRLFQISTRGLCTTNKTMWRICLLFLTIIFSKQKCPSISSGSICKLNVPWAWLLVSSTSCIDSRRGSVMQYPSFHPHPSLKHGKGPNYLDVSPFSGHPGRSICLVLVNSQNWSTLSAQMTNADHQNTAVCEAAWRL